ncbi:MAG: 2-amino-4-hydroxy-6-hydroxymethyldihydropteridine diphosphokinase [Candidatus Coatesbacteria bacterium]|nr:2-amino-4-hydroxy-6-hydroxymethyldihydropteridine diphosphokinase [Candidatus Coatesbacteria bacterium]
MTNGHTKGTFGGSKNEAIRPAVLAYIGLGSNLSDRESNLRKALDMIDSEDGVSILRVSSFCESEPVGPKDQPDFVNAVAEVQTSLVPRSLLEVLQRIEREMGRIRSRRWGPRLIDLDILLYGDLLISEPNLVIPHRLMHLRGFVLKPLCELIPEVAHPAAGLRFRELLDGVEQDACERGQSLVQALVWAR